MNENIYPNNFMANYEGMTGDKRLDARAQSLWDSMCRQPGSTMRKLSSTRAEQVA